MPAAHSPAAEMVDWNQRLVEGAGFEPARRWDQFYRLAVSATHPPLRMEPGRKLAGHSTNAMTETGLVESPGRLRARLLSRRMRFSPTPRPSRTAASSEAVGSWQGELRG